MGKTHGSTVGPIRLRRRGYLPAEDHVPCKKQHAAHPDKRNGHDHTRLDCHVETSSSCGPPVFIHYRPEPAAHLFLGSQRLKDRDSPKILVADSDTPASVSWYLCPVALSGRATKAPPKKEMPAMITRLTAMGQLQMNSQVIDITMRYICLVPVTKALIPYLAVSTSFWSLEIRSPDSWVSKYSALPCRTAWKILLLRLAAVSCMTLATM